MVMMTLTDVVLVMVEALVATIDLSQGDTSIPQGELPGGAQEDEGLPRAVSWLCRGYWKPDVVSMVGSPALTSTDPVPLPAPGPSSSPLIPLIKGLPLVAFH